MNLQKFPRLRSLIIDFNIVDFFRYKSLAKFSLCKQGISDLLKRFVENMHVSFWVDIDKDFPIELPQVIHEFHEVQFLGDSLLIFDI